MLCYCLMSRKSLLANDNSGIKHFLAHISLCANFQLFRFPWYLWPICSIIMGKSEWNCLQWNCFCVLIKLEGEDELLPKFGSVVNILQNEKGAIGLICKVLIMYGFDINWHFYDISWTEQFAFVNIDKLTSPFPMILVQMGSGSLFATVKHKI